MWCVKYEKWSGEKGVRFFSGEEDARTFYRKTWAKGGVVAQSISELGHGFSILSVRTGPHGYTAVKLLPEGTRKAVTVICCRRDLVWYRWFLRSAWNQGKVRLGHIENEAWRWLLKCAKKRAS